MSAKRNVAATRSAILASAGLVVKTASPFATKAKSAVQKTLYATRKASAQSIQRSLVPQSARAAAKRARSASMASADPVVATESPSVKEARRSSARKATL